ncbi:hypothetical protein LUX57_44700 [Actinomadura madurae]|uniref:hypothetical protein n=1 Tax=Actinomadura madurae TaxID=1993 RepID=UPI0020D23F83|nr:hypothetical protein [Actinomadura madurae]MCP9971348.1 hypothetical protein [Actinomadura madurae]
MTTDPHDEHGEILRRALHAEADSVNPAGDGLERIRARIADGQGRRFGFGRFGPARFGFDRFTVNWARPVLAVAAAVVIAALGVTAPQTIDLIQQSVGNSGPSHNGGNGTDGDRTDAGREPRVPRPVVPGRQHAGRPQQLAAAELHLPAGDVVLPDPAAGRRHDRRLARHRGRPEPVGHAVPERHADAARPPRHRRRRRPRRPTRAPRPTSRAPPTTSPPTKTSEQGDGASTP